MWLNPHGKGQSTRDRDGTSPAKTQVVILGRQVGFGCGRRVVPDSRRRARDPDRRSRPLRAGLDQDRAQRYRCAPARGFAIGVLRQTEGFAPNSYLRYKVVNFQTLAGHTPWPNVLHMEGESCPNDFHLDAFGILRKHNLCRCACGGW